MNWMKHKAIYFAFSLLLLIPGVVSLALYGLNLSIEFTGGSRLTLRQVSLDQSQISQIFSDLGASPSEIHSSGQDVDISLPPISQEVLDKAMNNIFQADPQASLAQFETVGPVLGHETLRKTVFAIILASVLILVYVAWTFKEVRFGVSAVLAMFHDSLILLGSFSLLGHFFAIKTDLLFVTAVLTTLSFSVHDTIVVYDRIRELSQKIKYPNFTSLANQAVSETFIRSLNNSLTIIFMLLALVLMGGDTIRNFALALLIGTVAGTYSSPFTAVPLLVVIDNLAKRLKK